jgi:hypothetical protein
MFRRPKMTMPARAGIVVGFDSAGAVRCPRPPSFKAYFFLPAFFLAFFFAFAILALQLSG